MGERKKSKRLPSQKDTKRNLKFVTIERINNGFLVSLPEHYDRGKFFKPTINGVISLLEYLWGQREVKIDINQPLEVTLEEFMEGKKDGE